MIFCAATIAAVQNIISMGAGIAFWPEYSWGAVDPKKLRLLPIADPVCERDLIVELHERMPRSAYAEDFYRFLLQKI